MAAHGYRVVAPWLPGYDAPTDKPISVGTYVRHLLDVRREHDGDGSFRSCATQAVVLRLLIQQIGMAEVALIAPGFWESLWADWSPGYDAADDIAELRRHVTADNISNVLGPYRASLNPQFVEPDAEAETLATMQLAPVPTLYLHGADDGAIGADLLADLGRYFPADGSVTEIVDTVGHFLHLENPEWVAARIGQWLGVQARTV